MPYLILAVTEEQAQAIRVNDTHRQPQAILTHSAPNPEDNIVVVDIVDEYQPRMCNEPCCYDD